MRNSTIDEGGLLESALRELGNSNHLPLLGFAYSNLARALVPGARFSGIFPETVPEVDFRGRSGFLSCGFSVVALPAEFQPGHRTANVGLRHDCLARPARDEKTRSRLPSLLLLPNLMRL